LKGAVYLEVKNLGSDVSGATYNPSWGPVPDVKRISIILNSDILDFARARDIVAILIHHMIHSYFLVACGPQKANEMDYGRLSHGHHFGKILTAIKKLSAAHGKELSQLNFGHDTGEYRTYEDIYCHLERDDEVQTEREKEKWYCSHCHADVLQIPRSNVEKWYHKYIPPMLKQTVKAIRLANVNVYNDRRHEIETKPRARMLGASKTVEFLYKDKAYLVETKKIEGLLSIQRAFLGTSSRFLKLDAKDVSESTFHRLLELIYTSTYRPENPWPSFSASSGPILKPDNGNGQAHVLADIQFVQFATILGFDECRSHAMKRLDSYAVVAEDPIGVLDEVFKVREPSKKLKDWVKRFLLAPYSSTSSLLAHGNMWSNADLSNLIKLESDHYPWRKRFLDAIENSGALENEVRKARQELRDKGWMPHSEQGLLTGIIGMMRYTSLPNLLTIGNMGMSGYPWQQQQLLLGNTGLAASSYPSNSLISTNTPTALSSAAELEHLKNLQWQKIQHVDREKFELREKLREKDRQSETVARIQAAAFMEQMCGTNFRGFVEIEDERY
jgi:hypothetical protein